MRKHRFFVSITAVFLLMLLHRTSNAAVPGNYLDPVPAMHVRGSTPSVVFKKSPSSSPRVLANISPYTHVVKSFYGKEPGSKEAHLGDRAGTWGMAALAYGLIKNPSADSGDQVPILGAKTDFPLLFAEAQFTQQTLDQVDWEGGSDGYYSVDFDFERVGVRSEVSFEPTPGLVIGVQGGITSRRISTPSFYDPAQSDPTIYDETSNDAIIGSFMKKDARRALADELGFDLSGYQDLKFEDITAQAVYSYPFELAPLDTEEPTLRLSPRITLGVILPTEELGSKTSTTSTVTTKESPFALPIGNEGFLGGMVEIGVSLDFKDTINFSAGAGYTIFKERAISAHRLPHNRHQSVLYLFKQDIHKKRGDSWHLTASLYGQDFIEHMKAFIDYTWVVHRPDKITLQDPSKLTLFKEGIGRYERDSQWRAGVLHCGLSYEMASCVEAGFAFQTPLHGDRVYRPYHFLATLSIGF